ncbi:MAG: LysR family transcriptional regulator [Terriglobia bacterium]
MAPLKISANMELRQLRYFRAVARLCSFTQAARHEGIAQPSLSQQIRKLEDELGGRLFDRLGRQIRLTALGEKFQEHATRVLNELEGARQEIEDMRGLRGGSVALGVIPTVAPYLMPQIVRAFSAECPHVQVKVTEGLTHSLRAQLAHGELDAALLSMPTTEPELITEPVIQDRMLLAVPARHRIWRQKRRRICFRDVADEPFLLLKEGHCFRDDFLNLCKDSRVNPHVVFEGGQFETLVAMVAAGFGITVLPAMGRARFQRAGVGLLDFVPPEPRRTIGIVRWKGKYLTPAARVLIEAIRRAASSRK